MSNQTVCPFAIVNWFGKKFTMIWPFKLFHLPLNVCPRREFFAELFVIRSFPSPAWHLLLPIERLSNISFRSCLLEKQSVILRSWSRYRSSNSLPFASSWQVRWSVLQAVSIWLQTLRLLSVYERLEEEVGLCLGNTARKADHQKKLEGGLCYKNCRPTYKAVSCNDEKSIT